MRKFSIIALWYDYKCLKDILITGNYPEIKDYQNPIKWNEQDILAIIGHLNINSEVIVLINTEIYKSTLSYMVEELNNIDDSILLHRYKTIKENDNHGTVNLMQQFLKKHKEFEGTLYIPE